MNWPTADDGPRRDQSPNLRWVQWYDGIINEPSLAWMLSFYSIGVGYDEEPWKWVTRRTNLARCLLYYVIPIFHSGFFISTHPSPLPYPSRPSCSIYDTSPSDTPVPSTINYLLHSQCLDVGADCIICHLKSNCPYTYPLPYHTYLLSLLTFVMDVAFELNCLVPGDGPERIFPPNLPVPSQSAPSRRR